MRSWRSCAADVSAARVRSACLSARGSVCHRSASEVSALTCLSNSAPPRESRRATEPIAPAKDGGAIMAFYELDDHAFDITAE